MSVFVKTYTFASGSKILSAQANTNFDDVSTFLNNSVIHVDGSKAFTALPSGPSLDPTSGNHLARKQYIDGVLGFSSGTTAQYTTAATVKTSIAANKTAADAAILQRPKLLGVGTGVSAGVPSVTTTQFLMQSGHTTINLDGSKRATITMPATFPTGLLTVVAVEGSEVELAATGYIVDGYTTSSFRVMLPLSAVTTHKVNWIAIGW